MSTQQETHDEVISEQVVADYLKHHRDFFTHHTYLLNDLRIPHESGAAVSLIERQIELLREQNVQLRNKFAALVEVGHDNEQLSRRVHAMTMALLEARDQAHVLQMIDRHLRDEFKVDAVAIRLRELEPGLEQATGISALDADDPVVRAHDRQFSEDQPVCGRLTAEQRKQVFGDLASGIESVALVPIGPGATLGLLGIGSNDARRFQGDTDTWFLKYLGDFIWRLLKRIEAESAVRD